MTEMVLILSLIASFILHAGGGHPLTTEPIPPPPTCHSGYPPLLDITTTTPPSPSIIQQQHQKPVHRKGVKSNNKPLSCPPLPPANRPSPTINSPTCIPHPRPFHPTTEHLESLNVPLLPASVACHHPPSFPFTHRPFKRLYHDMFAGQLTAFCPLNTPILELTPIPPAKYSIIPPYASKIFFTSPNLPPVIPSHVATRTQRSKERCHALPTPKTLCWPDSSFAIIKLEGCSSPTETDPSQAVQIIKEYHHKNSIFLGDIPLATRTVETYVDKETSHFINQNVRFTQALLAEIPSLSSLDTLSYNNEFETAIYYTPNEEGEGYDFILKMTPSEKVHFIPPPKNIIFVIDESNSIHKHHFNTFKAGVTRALSYMRRGDTFNIIIHRAHLTFMNASSIPWDKRAIETASRFLDSHRYKSSPAKYDTFGVITQILPCCDDAKENIFILLTDGKSLRSIESYSVALQQLMTTSQDRHLSIFTASVSRDNNFLMLDLISRFNSGELIHSGTHTSFPRKLATRTKYIGDLVARKISIQTTGSDDIDTEIKFYPGQHLLSPLYFDKPYVIYGSIKELNDFSLILQGITCDKQWINIKQHISFAKAEKATHAMKQEIALKRAHLCYHLFLQGADHTFLTEAQRHLPPNLLPDLLK